MLWRLPTASISVLEPTAVVVMLRVKAPQALALKVHIYSYSISSFHGLPSNGL